MTDNEVGLDSNLNKKCIRQESEPLEGNMFNNQPHPDSTEGPQTETSHAEAESNLEEDWKIKKEATDVIGVKYHSLLLNFRAVNLNLSSELYA